MSILSLINILLPVVKGGENSHFGIIMMTVFEIKGKEPKSAQ